jgi:hypothetical protein
MVLASSSARGRISALAVVSLCVCLFGVGTARGETPETQKAALDQSAELIFPLSVRLSSSAEWSLQYEHRFGENEFSAQIRRIPAPPWMIPLSWSRHLYVLDTDYWSPHSFQAGRTPTPNAHKQTRTFLNPLLPLGAMLRKVASDFAEDPVKASRWTLRFKDTTHPATFRRWVLEFFDPYEGYAGVSGLKAEFEVRNDKGEMIVLEAPITYKQAKSRTLESDLTRHEWESQANWRSVERFGDLPQIQVWTAARTHFVRLTANDAIAFRHLDAENLLLSVLKMERESFASRPLASGDFKSLAKEPKTQAIVAENLPKGNHKAHWTGYLIYTEHDDHFEVRSLGCLDVYQNLGVVPQLLQALAKFSRGKKYIVANLPPEQRRWLAEAGFRPWPSGAPIKSNWKNLREDTAVPSSAAGAFRLGIENSGIWALGRLPYWAQEGAVPAEQITQAEPAESYEGSAFEPYQESGYGELFSNYYSWEEDQDQPPVLTDLENLEKQLEDVRAASTDEEREAVTQKMLARYSKNEISSLNKQWYFLSVPYTAFEPFLSEKLRQLAGEVRMRTLVMDYLNRLDAADGHPGHYELRTKLVDVLNNLRRILQPNRRVVTLDRVERVARHFAETGGFPDLPRYTANLRGREYSVSGTNLSSLNVPPKPNNWAAPYDIHNVLIIAELPGKPRFAALGDLRTVNDLWFDGILRSGQDVGTFSKEMFRRHYWIENYVGRAKPVQLHPSEKVFSPTARVILQSLEKLPEPKHPLHIGFFLVDAARSEELYVVLSSQDPQWHLAVVNAELIEPSDSLIALDKPLEVHSSLNCESVILNANRVIHFSRRN